MADGGPRSRDDQRGDERKRRQGDEVAAQQCQGADGQPCDDPPGEARARPGSRPRQQRQRHQRDRHRRLVELRVVERQVPRQRVQEAGRGACELPTHPSTEKHHHDRREGPEDGLDGPHCPGVDPANPIHGGHEVGVERVLVERPITEEKVAFEDPEGAGVVRLLVDHELIGERGRLEGRDVRQAQAEGQGEDDRGHAGETPGRCLGSSGGGARPIC